MSGNRSLGMVWNCVGIGTLLILGVRYLWIQGGFDTAGKATDFVREYTLQFDAPDGAQQYSIEQLICLYDPSNGTICTGGLMHDALLSTIQKQVWRSSVENGRIIVTCECNGKFYSFTTDMVNISPNNEISEGLLGLSGSTLTPHEFKLPSLR